MIISKRITAQLGRLSRSLVVCIALIGAGTSATAQTLKMATIAPDGLAWIKQLRSAMKAIDQETEGRVKFKLYPGGVQGDDSTVLRKMRIGQLQGGALAAGALIRFYTDLQIYNMPLQFKNSNEVQHVRAEMDPGIIDGIKQSGVHVFPLIETGFAYLLSKKPVSKPEDLTNLKVWVPDGDPLGEQLVKLFKVSPVPLNITDVLAALQTGLVDAVAVPPLVAIALQWHNHVDYMMDLPLMYIYSVLAVDGRAMKKISAGDQAVIASHLDPLMKEIDAVNRDDNLKAFEAILSQGVTSIKPSADDLVAWNVVAVDALAAMLAAEEVSQPILDQFLASLEAYRMQAQ
ncbi:MAG: TRAP transporter substrate-binding protein DctP [Pseudomonadales bacterium]|jgi:TRAP-type C4-dicarboxylate transport system substrate-binding protein|tara:strand:- start:8433 stop:9467 length:1035 start_codon:yes stop_codon:yes gene_type:complete